MAEPGPVVAVVVAQDGLTRDAINQALERAGYRLQETADAVNPAAIEANGSRREREVARYRLLFERNQAAVLFTRENGDILDCNDAAARILNLGSRAEAVGRCVLDFYATPQRPRPRHVGSAPRRFSRGS